MGKWEKLIYRSMKKIGDVLICVLIKKENPCNLLNYKGLSFFLVAGTGLEPATFGL